MSFRTNAAKGYKRIQRRAAVRVKINNIEYAATNATDIDAISGDSGGLAHPDFFSLAVLKSDLNTNKVAHLQEIEVLNDEDTWETVQVKAIRGMKDQSTPVVVLDVGSPDD